MLAIRGTLALSGAVGAAKAGTQLTEAAGKAVGQKLDELLDKKAFDTLMKSGGAVDNAGQPLLGLKPLTVDQKRVMGELFGENTVKQIVPDGQKLARMPGVGETGIDDLYKVSRPDVDYVVIEYKFVGTEGKTGAQALGNTTDGRQGSLGWITGGGKAGEGCG